MALTAVNPKILETPSGGKLAEVSMLATNSKTWKKGELCILANGAGTVEPLDGADSRIYGVFLQDQDESTSSTTVQVGVLESGTVLEMYVTNNGNAAAINTANIGVGYDAYEASGICYLDVNGTTGAQFKVRRLFNEYAAELASRESYVAGTTAPGICEVVFTQAATA